MGGLRSEAISYCGAPPAPAELLGRWNLDPVLIVILAGLLFLCLTGARRRGARRAAVWALVAGWAVASLALVSPLCPLSVSLFSARVGQHMVLTLLAAPLIALGRPAEALAAIVRREPPKPGPGQPMLAAAAFAALLWFWHAPTPYAATFQSAAAYWAMHVTLLGVAVWLWGEILNRPAGAGVVGACALSMIQMGLLGALITLAPRAVYAPHLLTTAAWGLRPLEDQQLGGAIMWAPGSLSFLAALTYVGWRALRPALGRAASSGPVGQAG
jgi:putative membrane protein